MSDITVEERILQALFNSVKTQRVLYDEGRVAGLEEAAAWHDHQVEVCLRMASATQNRETGRYHTHRAERHRNCACAIRSLHGAVP